MDTHTHIYIQKSHYRTVQRKSLYGSEDEFMESVEKYLDRNGIPFTLHEKGVKIGVSDRFQAHTICTHFWLHDIAFIEGTQGTVLFWPTKVTKQGKAIYARDYTTTPVSIPRPRKKKKEEPTIEEVWKFRWMFAWSPVQKLFEEGPKEWVQWRFFNIKNKKWADTTITKKAQ